jgi:hypothetical protein
MTKNNSPLERDEQKTLVDYLEIKKLRFSAIPNSTWTPSIKQKALNKRMGLRPGLPDLLIYINADQSKHGYAFLLFIELKRQKGSATSQAQKDWIKALQSVSRVGAYICKGFDEARKIVDSHVR